MLEQAGSPGPLAPAEGILPPSPRVAPEAHDHADHAHAVHPHAVHPEQGQWATPPPGRFERLLIAAWTRPKWLAPLAVLGCVGAAFTYVLQNNPTDNQADPLGPCAFKLLTGFDCPGCGGTRMVWYLLHGNVAQAARYHFVALAAVPVLAWAYIVWAVYRITGYKLPSKSIPLPVILGYLVFWFVFAVLRNLPWAPFDWFYVS